VGEEVLLLPVKVLPLLEHCLLGQLHGCRHTAQPCSQQTHHKAPALG
jgi:hypothetical protein